MTTRGLRRVGSIQDGAARLANALPAHHERETAKNASMSKLHGRLWKPAKTLDTDLSMSIVLSVPDILSNG